MSSKDDASQWQVGCTVQRLTVRTSNIRLNFLQKGTTDVGMEKDMLILPMAIDTVVVLSMMSVMVKGSIFIGMVEFMRVVSRTI